jgi:hypothetical protein
MKRQVKVWNDTVEIDVHQSSKTVWIATGEYHGKPHEAKRSSASAAAKAWADAATYHSN